MHVSPVLILLTVVVRCAILLHMLLSKLCLVLLHLPIQLDLSQLDKQLDHVAQVIFVVDQPL